MISLVVVLGIVTTISLVFLVIQTSMTNSSQGRHSISAARAQERAQDQATAAMKEMAEFQRETVRQAGEMALRATDAAIEVMSRSKEVVEIQAALTETLLLGRPMQPTEQPPQLESESETSMTPADLEARLPSHVVEAIARDRETAGVWPDPSEMLPDPSANGNGPIRPDQVGLVDPVWGPQLQPEWWPTEPPPT